MSYLNKILQADEQVIAVGRMHWIVYVRGVMMLLVGVAFILIEVIEGPAEAIVNIVASLVAFYGVT